MVHIDGTVGYICTIPMVYEPFVTSMIQLVQYNQAKGIRVWYNRTTVGSQAVARNHLVKSMLGEWLFFVDTDIVFPHDTLEKMLKIQKQHNLDVLSGVYYYRQPPHLPAVYQTDNGTEIWNQEPEYDSNGLGKAFLVGGGCLLVKRKVFDRIKQELNEEPFSIIEDSGEDFSFCRRLTKLNIPIHVTNTIAVDHLGLTPINRTHYKPA